MIAEVTLLLGLFLGINIGGNNASSAMGAAYGAKVRGIFSALLLVLLFATLGAILSGEAVIRTIGEGIVPKGIISPKNAIIIIIAASSLIFLANIIKLPLSTSQVIVGAIAGLGFFYNAINHRILLTIVGWWILTPVVAYATSYLAGRYVYMPLLFWIADKLSIKTAERLIGAGITLSGCFVAYSIGANNAANAVGPIVGAGILSYKDAVLMGGFSIGLGALILGKRVLETVGDNITDLCIISAILVQVIAGSLLYIASHMGIPISLNETVTASIIGIGCAKNGNMVSNNTVRRITLAWVVSPFLAGVITFGSALLL